MNNVNDFRKKALIAMSGGVDSSVAAYLMREQGFDCMGATMRLYTNALIGLDQGHTCCSLDDAEDARSVAYNLGIPFYVFNFSDRFKDAVIDKFVACYECGMTPNPCIDCNRYLKFDYLFDRAKELGCDFIATGHYAKIDYNADSGRYLLKKAKNPEKDQSYVLYSLKQEQLAHIIFPLGNMSKDEVRKVASSHGFVNAAKHESQDICFVPNGRYAEFIEHYTKKQYAPGHFVDTKGNILGEHKGIIHYTIGQRKGLGLSLKEPMYVKDINVHDNTVIIARDAELFTSSLIADDVNLISVSHIEGEMRIMAKVRYRHTEQCATARQLPDGRLSVEFDEPQRAITKGQAVVLYDGDTLVGGGTIVEV